MSRHADDPAALYRCHVFYCVNQREEGHPRGCCADKGSVELREYMKAKAKEMGLKRVRINSSGCLDLLSWGRRWSSIPKASGTGARPRRTWTKSLKPISEKAAGSAA